MDRPERSILEALLGDGNPQRPQRARELRARLRRALFRALLVGLLPYGCGVDSRALSSEVQEQVGTVELQLVSHGQSGAQYRLRSAVIMIQGPSSTLFLDSESDPKGETLRATVPVGDYTAFLQEGWRLESLSEKDQKEATNATLESANPLEFVVREGESTAVALRFKVSSEAAAAEGSFEIAIEVDEVPETSPLLCQRDADCAGNETCCVAGFYGTCLELQPGAVCPLPDLTVSSQAVLRSLRFENEFFEADSCALQEGCVDGEGLRRLMRFTTETPNIGDADLILGEPSEGLGFEYAECHGHFHFEGYASYELLDGSTGSVIVAGHKQAFCLLDSSSLGLDGAPENPRFHCAFQGIQRGWTDAYEANLDCQWIDVSDVPPGNYVLRLNINPEHILPESNYDNNSAEIPVFIGDPTTTDPLATCTTPEQGEMRECGWLTEQNHQGASCEPGEDLLVGCRCPAGLCYGDPVLRVCEGDAACVASDALGSGDDSCGYCPQVAITCPASGQYTVMIGPFLSTDTNYGCVVGTVSPPSE